MMPDSSCSRRCRTLSGTTSSCPRQKRRWKLWPNSSTKKLRDRISRSSITLRSKESAGMMQKLFRLHSLPIRFLLIAVVFSLSTLSHADVTLPALLADHMVIQRGLPVHVWGMAAPHEAVSATFRGETKSTTAADDGRWSVFLSPGEAGGPFPLLVKATNTITLSDILVSDVWVASGQSNMEFPVTGLVNAQTEIAAAQYPRIRIFRVDHKPADYPLENVSSKGWAAGTPETVGDLSAGVFFFARNIQQKLGVPIGLIETYWGGTPAESWTSLHALSADASLMPVFAARAKTVDK